MLLSLARIGGIHPIIAETNPIYRPSRRPLYSPSCRPYRHSRVSGNPAVACQECGIIRQYRRDSRLRGNDDRGPAMTVE